MPGSSVCEDQSEYGLRCAAATMPLGMVVGSIRPHFAQVGVTFLAGHKHYARGFSFRPIPKVTGSLERCAVRPEHRKAGSKYYWRIPIFARDAF
jgi:hypothetical protein